VVRRGQGTSRLVGLARSRLWECLTADVVRLAAGAKVNGGLKKSNSLIKHQAVRCCDACFA
jgi:hypothetical protein